MFEAVFGEPGEDVPVVDVADLHAVWKLGHDLGAQHQGPIAATMFVWAHVCSADADVRAVVYRCWMLGVLEGMLRVAWTGGQLSEHSFKAAATMPLQWLAMGVVHEGLPFDVGAFFHETAA